VILRARHTHEPFQAELQTDVNGDRPTFLGTDPAMVIFAIESPDGSLYLLVSANPAELEELRRAGYSIEQEVQYANGLD